MSKDQTTVRNRLPNRLGVACPKCGQPIGSGCVTKQFAPAAIHTARLAALDHGTRMTPIEIVGSMEDQNAR